MSIQITGAILKNIAKSLTLERANMLATIINKKLIEYSFETKEQVWCFLATIIHESGEFTIKTENMNYTTPKRIVDVWPSRFNLTGVGGKLNANKYIRNARLLANTVYNGRMGNKVNSDDGYNFRGGGYIQLTGRESYDAYAKYKQLTNVEEVSDKIRTTEEYAIDSAFWEFVVDKKLLPIAQKGDFTTVTKRINGGTIGMESRLKYYNLCKRYI